MQLHPTRATFHVALAGLLIVGVSVAARVGAAVAFGGAMVLAVAVGRALARASVTRLRGAGFEMLWKVQGRVERTRRGGVVTIKAELRNRGMDDARIVNIRPLVSSLLDAEVEPNVVDLPSASAVLLTLTVRAKRVGRWGIHGVTLEVRSTPAGGEALYEVPLMFANPLGIEVYPRTLHAMLQAPRGGRSRHSSSAGRPSRLLGEGDELREIREHVPGDPFKRIAWKASARRGQLMVREMERDEREVVWLVLDASVELWAGLPGHAPLDHGVDEIAALAARHLARGDRVGLVVTASRQRTWLPPDEGVTQGARIAAALASSASTVDVDRCELDEVEIAQRVSEHARPLDPRGLLDLPRHNLDLLASRAEQLRARAPFTPRHPEARSERERRLRHYVASFGIEVPPRTAGERAKTDESLAALFEKLAKERPRATLIHVWSPAPDADGPLALAVKKLRAQRIQIRWSMPPLEESVTGPLDARDVGSVAAAIRSVAEEAVVIRAHASRQRGEIALRKLGIVHVRPPIARVTEVPGREPK